MYHTQFKQKNRNTTLYVISVFACILCVTGVWIGSRHVVLGNTKVSMSTPDACETETVVSVAPVGWYICDSHTFVKVIVSHEATSELTMDCLVDGVKTESPAQMHVTYIGSTRQTQTIHVTEPTQVCTWTWIISQDPD